MGKLLKIIAGLFVVVIIAVVVLITNLDRTIKAAVEELGPDYVKAPVSLSKVNLSLKTGEGVLGGLVIGNPAGFNTKQAFSLGEIAVKLDNSTVTEPVIVIEKVHIVKPDITYESGKSGSNIDQLQKNVMSAIGSGQSSGSESASGDGGAERKFIIRDLRVLDGAIHYSNPILSGKTIDVALPDIRLTNIGQKSGGATGAEVLEQVLKTVNSKASSAIAGSGAINDLKGQLEEKTKQAVQDKLGDQLKGLFNRD